MDDETAMKAALSRHSVRQYTDREIEGEVKAALEAEITECNRDGNLSMRLVTGDDDGVSGILSRISRFSNVRNYIVVAGPDDGSLDERGGYHGERVVLLAQSLGLNTCWSATYNKRAVSRHVEPGNKTVCIIAIGYGTTQGENHRSKPVGSVSKSDGDPPEWFLKGVECALLAPTARNQQRFLFTLDRDGGVRAEATGGFLSSIDLGIAKYHFEIGAGRDSFNWA